MNISHVKSICDLVKTQGLWVVIRTKLVARGQGHMESLLSIREISLRPP